jgi:hypothetical protein
MTSTATEPIRVDDLSPAAVLAAARDRRREADRAEADLLVLAARWADLHPPEGLADAASYAVPGSEHEEPVAGDGCPPVAEFCLAELGSVLGTSTTAGKRLVGHALELRHRLPRLWRRMQAGEVAPWRARRIAEATIHAHPALSPEAAAWVDAQVAPFAERIGSAQLDRTVAEAVRRQQDLLPDDPEDDNPPCADPRHVTLDDQHVSWTGTLRLEAELDLADALDLDHTVRAGAERLKALGSREGLDARRARALGELARRQSALDLATENLCSPPAGSTDDGGTAAIDPTRTSDDTTPGLPPARELVLHLHFDATGADVDPLGRLEEGQRLLLLEQVKSWCGDSHTRITVRPVIDLGVELSTPGYRPTARQVELARLRDGTCVFPWCSRPARACDVDHVTAFDHEAHARGEPQPGPTTTSNLAPLCRRHHRVKTHGSWRATPVGNGVVKWTSPHGHGFRRDRTGTIALPGPDRP